MNGKEIERALVKALGVIVIAELDGPKSRWSERRGNLASVLCLLTFARAWREAERDASPADSGADVWGEIEKAAERVARKAEKCTHVRIGGPKGRRIRGWTSGGVIFTPEYIKQLMVDEDRVADRVGRFLLGDSEVCDRSTTMRAAVAVVAVVMLCNLELDPSTRAALEAIAEEDATSILEVLRQEAAEAGRGAT